MMKIRTVIIEDEEPARDILRHYLSNIKEIEICAECPDGFSGLKAVSELKPDLVFLDIQMPKLNGFEMLEVLTGRPEIIFTTAYDQYAIKAFELNAVDYLLKPFSGERLEEAVRKATGRLKARRDDDKRLPENIFEKLPSALSRIVVRKGNDINIIPVNQIKYIEAQDDYVMVYYTGGKALKQQTMKFYEENLPHDCFIRIHRSYIVRAGEIKKLEPYSKDNYVAILNSGEKLPVSRAGYKRLKNELRF
ncbi:MAG: LytR/AlgR family response regulator transcription factor [Bacteroidales bacterium]